MIQMQEILEMSVAERILIVEKIWDSIEHDNTSIPIIHQQELDRRLERYANGETTFISWDSIKKEINAAK